MRNRLLFAHSVLAALAIALPTLIYAQQGGAQRSTSRSARGAAAASSSATAEVEKDVAEALTRAGRVFEGTFRTQIHAPVGMETRAALAEWQGEALTVWKTSRAVHANDRQTLARVLGIPPAQVRVICTSMGGGFGNKDESRLAVLVALLARLASDARGPTGVGSSSRYSKISPTATRTSTWRPLVPCGDRRSGT